jgi:transposase
MTSDERAVIGGVDTHRDTHHAVALDERGRLLGDASFGTDPSGLRALLEWLRGFGVLTAVGVEGTGTYGGELTRLLQAQGVPVAEVCRPNRRLRRLRGKSDPIDAEAAARAVLSGEADTVPKDRTGVVEAIRMLRLTRDGAVKARTAAANQLRDLLVTAPASVREPLRRLSTGRRVQACARLRPDVNQLADPAQAAKTALRHVAGRILALNTEIRALDTQLTGLVATAAPRTTALLGVSTDHAGQLLVTAGDNPDRLRSDAAFAHLCAAAPIPASSGRTQRHRLTTPATDKPTEHST